MTFFTNDDGLYVLDSRDAPAFADRNDDGTLDFQAILDAVKGHIRKIHDGRLRFPSEVPYTEAHNTWVANKPGTLLVIPVGGANEQTLVRVTRTGTRTVETQGLACRFVKLIGQEAWGGAKPSG